MTAFHSLAGPLEQCTRFHKAAANAMQEFQRCVLHALQGDVPHNVDPFVDDAGIKGPPSTYNDEPIKGNPRH